MGKQDVKGKARARVAGRPRARSKTRAERPKLIEEDPAITERILKAQLKLMGLYAAHTLGDGNCLFRALSDQLYGSPSSHQQLRHDICEFVARNSERYRLFVDEDSVPGGFDGHLAAMRLQGTYGTHIELSALAQLYRRPIKVVQPGLVYVIDSNEASNSRGCTSLKPVPGCESRDSEGTEASVRDDDEDEPGPLYIVYHTWEHYSSLRNLEGPHTGLPHVKEIVPARANRAAVPPSPGQPVAPALSATVSSKPKNAKSPYLPPRILPPIDPTTGLPVVPVKRGRGRPRKYPLVFAETATAQIAGASISRQPDADDETSVRPASDPAASSLVVRLVAPSLATLAPAPDRPPSRAGRTAPPEDLLSAPPSTYPTLSEHLQHTLRKHRPSEPSMSLSPVMHPRSRHESAEESSTGSTPVGSLSSGSSVSSPASASGEAEGEGDALTRYRARPPKSGTSVKGPSGKEKRERRLEAKRRKAEIRSAAERCGLRRSKRGVPAMAVAEGVLGAVKELCI